MIPEAAVEAAARVFYGHACPDVIHSDRRFAMNQMRAALEAAAPHMRQAFFLEMNLRAVKDELNTPLQFGNANRGATP